MLVEPDVFPDPEALGAAAAAVVLDRLRAHPGRDPFVLGCPGGRSATSTYQALAAKAAAERLDLSRLVVAMMDEYVVVDPDAVDPDAVDPGAVDPGARYRAVHDDLPHSCRRFGRDDIVGRILAAQRAAGVPTGHRIRPDNLWLPDPADPAGYERRLTEVGGVTVFLLASGAGDGHVAFNPPGSAIDSRTRVVELPESTRRDNLSTFPTFAGELAAVPRHGVTVGIGTIREHSHEVLMLVHGPGKRAAARRLSRAVGYDPSWPATVLAECRNPRLLVDRAALPLDADCLPQPVECQPVQ